MFVNYKFTNHWAILVGCTILEANEFGDLPNYQAGFTKSGTCQGFEDDEALWC